MMAEDIGTSTQSFDNRYDHVFKLLMVGNSNVGKTSFISMYSRKEFSEGFQPTVGIDYWAKHLPNYKGKYNILLQVWDTAGQERYQSVSNAYYRGANAFILMFDLTNLESYKACKQWIAHIQENAPEEATLILVGNKSDLRDELKLPNEEVNGMALSMDIKYFECSVKNNTNVEEIIEYVLNVLIEEAANKKVKPEESPIMLQSTDQPDGSPIKSKCAC